MRYSRFNTIVLLSGGLDSTVALAEVVARGDRALALTFNYGQRSFDREMRSAGALCEHYGVPYEVVGLPWLSDLLPGPLSPNMENTDWSLLGAPHVWVPNRNGVFLNIGAAYAETYDAGQVVFGANADEAAEFPDNTQDYRDAVTKALAYSTLSEVRVETPVGHLSKADIIRRGVELGVPFHLIWSCYEEGETHCGRCPSCKRLRAALGAQPKPPPVVFQG